MPWFTGLGFGVPRLPLYSFALEGWPWSRVLHVRCSGIASGSNVVADFEPSLWKGIVAFVKSGPRLFVVSSRGFVRCLLGGCLSRKSQSRRVYSLHDPTCSTSVTEGDS